MKTVLCRIAIAFMLLPISGFSQKIQIGGEFGYHSYNMKDLKNINEKIVKNLPFDAKLISNYPSYATFGFFIDYNYYKNYRAGVKYNSNSTGSRISSIDYSGEYYLNSILKSGSVSIYLSSPLIKQNAPIEFNGVLNLGFSTTTFNMQETLVLFDIEHQSDGIAVRAKSVFIAPAIAFNYKFSPFMIGVNSGYQLDIIKGDFASIENENYKLQDSRGNSIHPDWSGIFANISFAFIF